MGDAVSNSEASVCRPADVAAYLDGELDSVTAAAFERHTRACSPCAAALLEQKRLLCLFDTAFDETFEKKIDLPKNFARVITTRARTDMSGLRCPAEHRRAFVLSALLALVSFCLLGAALFDEAFAPLVSVAQAALGLLRMVGHALGDAGAGASLILRTLGSRFVAGLLVLRVSVWLLFGGALFLLLRLIGNYHRAQIND